METSLRTARPSRTTLLLKMEARCTIRIMDPSMRTARPSRTTLLLDIKEARCTIMMEPALELTACAEEIPQTILIPMLGLAISVLTVRDLGIFLITTFLLGNLDHFETSPFWWRWRCVRKRPRQRSVPPKSARGYGAEGSICLGFGL